MFAQLQPLCPFCLQKPHDQAIAQELIDAFDLRFWELWLGDVGSIWFPRAGEGN